MTLSRPVFTRGSVGYFTSDDHGQVASNAQGIAWVIAPHYDGRVSPKWQINTAALTDPDARWEPVADQPTYSRLRDAIDVVLGLWS